MNQILDSLSQEEILALTIYGEARSQPVQGQIAVGCVIRNRVRAQHKHYIEICLAPKQFSCWNESDPNRVILLEIAEKLVNGQELLDIHYEQALFIAHGIIDNQLIDNTNNAINYLTEDLFFSNKKPTWAINAKNVRTIGDHTFFNA